MWPSRSESPTIIMIIPAAIRITSSIIIDNVLCSCYSWECKSPNSNSCTALYPAFPHTHSLRIDDGRLFTDNFFISNNLRTFTPICEGLLPPFFRILCARAQLISFQSFAHSLYKTPGCTPLCKNTRSQLASFLSLAFFHHHKNFEMTAPVLLLPILALTSSLAQICCFAQRSLVP